MTFPAMAGITNMAIVACRHGTSQGFFIGFDMGACREESMTSRGSDVMARASHKSAEYAVHQSRKPFGT